MVCIHHSTAILIIPIRQYKHNDQLNGILPLVQVGKAISPLPFLPYPSDMPQFNFSKFVFQTLPCIADYCHLLFPPSFPPEKENVSDHCSHSLRVVQCYSHIFHFFFFLTSNVNTPSLRHFFFHNATYCLQQQRSAYFKYLCCQKHFVAVNSNFKQSKLMLFSDYCTYVITCTQQMMLVLVPSISL